MSFGTGDRAENAIFTGSAGTVPKRGVFGTLLRGRLPRIGGRRWFHCAASRSCLRRAPYISYELRRKVSRKEKGVSLAQRFAQVFGGIYLLVGILGFIPPLLIFGLPGRVGGPFAG